MPARITQMFMDVTNGKFGLTKTSVTCELQPNARTLAVSEC